MQKFDLIQFLSDTNNEKNIDKLFQLLTDACSSIGLDRAVYSLITPHDTINMPAGHAIIGNYPQDWMSYYSKKRYVQIDPVIKHIKQTENIFRWDDLNKLDVIKNDKESKLMDEAHEAGLYSGVGLPLKNYHGEIVGMGFASSEKNIPLSPAALNFIAIVSKQFDLNYKSIMLDKKHSKFNHKQEKNILTARQQEILLWISKDKSYGDIADILKISENTVLYHMKEIFKRLKVHSQISAVLKAIKLGLINL